MNVEFFFLSHDMIFLKDKGVEFLIQRHRFFCFPFYFFFIIRRRIVVTFIEKKIERLSYLKRKLLLWYMEYPNVDIAGYSVKTVFLN